MYSYLDVFFNQSIVWNWRIPGYIERVQVLVHTLSHAIIIIPFMELPTKDHAAGVYSLA